MENEKLYLIIQDNMASFGVYVYDSYIGGGVSNFTGSEVWEIRELNAVMITEDGDICFETLARSMKESIDRFRLAYIKFVDLEIERMSAKRNWVMKEMSRLNREDAV